ncbi:MAG: hypothetical protein Q7T44_02075 [Parvibaculum sp.]|nr:hypothetical protein [Parvibaculum sp.]
MSLSARQIAGHAGLLPLLRLQAQTLLTAYESDPRLAANFASQQRWLLGQLAASLHFRSELETNSSGVPISRFIDQAQAHGIASRNTADAFIKELINYGYVELAGEAGDKRLRLLRATSLPVELLDGWVALHLSTLDRLDGGARGAAYSAHGDGLMRLQPLIADGLLTLEEVRKPSGTFSLFTWLDKGGIVMERMISGMDEIDKGSARIPTSVMSVSDMAEWLKLSRTHLTRKLREAEALGSIGWDGKRFHSAMWLSAEFLAEMVAAQAAKLAVIDEAYDKVFGVAAR